MQALQGALVGSASRTIRVLRVAVGLLTLYEDVCRRAQFMTETISIRISSDMKKQLHALAKRSRRSKSFLAAEAITAYVQAEEWQVGEIQVGLQDLETANHVVHARVVKWLRS